MSMTSTQWQPIETAPRDGTRVLLCVVGHIPSVAWLEEKPDGIPYSPRQWKWRNVDAADFDSDAVFYEHWLEHFYEPTHWMPLPPPPSETDADSA